MLRVNEPWLPRRLRVSVRFTDLSSLKVGNLCGWVLSIDQKQVAGPAPGPAGLHSRSTTACLESMTLLLATENSAPAIDAPVLRVDFLSNHRCEQGLEGGRSVWAAGCGKGIASSQPDGR